MSRSDMGGATLGLSGKIRSARANAPDGATDEDIRTVALEAWQRERRGERRVDVNDVWREVKVDDE